MPRMLIDATYLLTLTIVTLELDIRAILKIENLLIVLLYISVTYANIDLLFMVSLILKHRY